MARGEVGLSGKPQMSCASGRSNWLSNWAILSSLRHILQSRADGSIGRLFELSVAGGRARGIQVSTSKSSRPRSTHQSTWGIDSRD